MKLRALVLATSAVYLIGSTPVAADPVSTAVAGLFFASGTAAFAVTASLVQLGVGLALSQLGLALKGRPGQAPSPGIRTEVTLEGGTLPQTRLLGRTVTAGALVAPYYTNGRNDDIENAFLHKVIDLADAPIHSLQTVWIDDVFFEVDDNLVGSVTSYDGATPNPATHLEWTQDVDNLYVRFFDGRQTVADQLMVDRFADHDERPWTAARVGTGVAYVRTIHRYDQDVVKGDPQLLFVVEGERLYDRRNDSTAGGAGAQRATVPSTWGYTENPFVMVEAVLRGLPIADGAVWGLGVDDADLPVTVWTTAQDHCDETVEGGKRYKAGIEVVMATAENGGTDPFDVIDELLKACAGAIADAGGTWVCRAGPPGLPIAYITDDDVVVSRPQDFEPHKGLTDVYNACRALYANVTERWKAKEAPLRTDAAAEAQDGERLVATLDVSKTVWMEPQVQRLQKALLADARRMRRHTVTLPPEFSGLLPLDVLSWTSARNGYVDKLFEIAEVAIEPTTLATTFALREVDPADYDWSPTDALPSTVGSGIKVIVVPGPLPGFAVEGVILTDASGAARRPAIEIAWSPTITGQTSITWEARIQATGAPGPTGSTTNVKKGLAYEDGVLPATAYELRARGDRTGWTTWTPVTTPAVYLSGLDLDPRFEEAIARNEAALAALDRSFEQEIGNLARAQAYSVLDVYALRADLGARFATYSVDLWQVAEESRGLSASLTTQISAAYDAAAALVAQEIGIRVAEDEALAYALTVVEAALEGQEGEIAGLATGATELSARVTETEEGLEALSQETTILTSSLGDALDEATAEAAAASLRALLGDHAGRAALKLQVADAREQLTAQVSEAQGALAQQLVELTAAFDGSLAVADRQLRAQADELSAEATARLALAASVSSLTATFITEQIATATAFLAQATDISLLQVVVGDEDDGLVAEVSDTSLALATVEGNLEASRVLRVRAGDALGTVEMVAVDDAISGPASMIRLRADRLQLIADELIELFGNVSIVGTVSIKGRAVTIPAVAYFDQDVDIISATDWRNIFELTLPKVAGYGVAMDVTIPFAGYGDGTIQVRLRRGTVGLIVFDEDTGEAGGQSTFSTSYYDPDTSAGSVRYYVDVRKGQWSGRPYDLVIDRRCFLRLTETLR